MKITIEKNDGGIDYIKIHGYVQMDALIIFLSKYYPDFTWKDVYIAEDLKEHETIPAKDITTTPAEETNEKLQQLIQLFELNISQNRTK